MKFLEQFKSARLAGVPLLGVETSDPASTVQQVGSLYGEKVPILLWDISGGLTPWNQKGQNILSAVLGKKEPGMMNNPSEMLAYMAKLPPQSILFMMNGHRFIGEKTTSEASVGQAIWNLRDKFKELGNERTLAILGPYIQLPAELRNDVMILDEPLPTSSELENLVKRLYEAANESRKVDKLSPLPELKETTLTSAVEAVRGLSMFAAEQVIAMSLKKEGIDLEQVWERKRKQIEQTPGLSIYRGTETYADVRGAARLLEYLNLNMKGKDQPTCLVFMDEIEKMFAGIQGDLSGTSQEQHGEFLRWSQDNKVPGLMLVGHPGCGKSIIAKATAGEFKVPMVELNMSALKGSLVGQTGAQTRNALKMILAIGRPLMLATSNSLQTLPPELKRRFKLGTFFCDLPTIEEKEALWQLYLKKYSLKFDRPDDTDWTPADIETCCNISWRLGINLSKASGFMTPIAKSDPERIEALRNAATGRYLSASEDGVFNYSNRKVEVLKQGFRSIRTSGGENIGQA